MNDDTTPSSNPYAAPDADLSVQETDHEDQLAGKDQRFIAAMIDGIIISCLLLVPLIFFFGGWTAYVTKTQSNPYQLKLIGFVLGLIVYLVVNGHLLSKNGQTVGKKVVGIKIVRSDGSPASLIHIIGRRFIPVSLCQFVPVLGSFLPLIDVLFIFRESRKCLHDSIADTIVVRD